jgi:hypothetical protein
MSKYFILPDTFKRLPILSWIFPQDLGLFFFWNSFTSAKTARVSKWIETKNRHVCLRWLAVIYSKSRMVFIYRGCVLALFGGFPKSLKTICPYALSWSSFCPVITLGPVPERNHYSLLWMHSPHYNVSHRCFTFQVEPGTGKCTTGTSRWPLFHLRRNQKWYVTISKQFWCPVSSFFTVGQVAICWFQFWCGWIPL